ncbi:hypothetical protein [Mesobacillus subterraneus]|uniref:Uncharacterized protein n=1 Tax=Mesobacillus subterraneus TaxID=285983 RepID=A0A0D6Z6I2_9BACI|nr:hypothetical protein [Mesobacillus subterraneus]KIY20661.1 hypothetical protein UB32_17845 [Mesobacillus subterraneus]
MFNVQELTEKAGYEYWVLRKCLVAIEKHAGVSSDVTVAFRKDGTKEHIMQMYSEFGSEKRVQVIEDLSPLLFVSSYKMIDMYIEWILYSNGQQVPRRFDQKYKTCIENASTLSLPTPISVDDRRDTGTGTLSHHFFTTGLVWWLHSRGMEVWGVGWLGSVK